MNMKKGFLFVLLGTQAYSSSSAFLELVQKSLALINEIVPTSDREYFANTSGVMTALALLCPDYKEDVKTNKHDILTYNNLKPPAKKTIRNAYFIAKKTWMCSTDVVIPGMIMNFVDWDDETYLEERVPSVPLLEDNPYKTAW